MTDADSLISFFGKWPVPWSVLFVEAPIDAVSDAYEKTLKRPVIRNLPLAWGGDLGGLPLNTVVQVRDSDWVMLFHEFDGVIPVLSGFRHRVLEFAGGEGTLVDTCQLCTPFEKPIRYRTQRDRDIDDDYYNSSGNEKPDRSKERTVSSYSEVFNEYGVRAACVERSPSGAVLLSDGDSEKNVVRVDAADSKWFHQE